MATSPVIDGGLIYTVSREGNFTIMDQATGEVVDQRKLDFVEGKNSVYPSVALAGAHIYLGCQEGTMVVLKPGRAYEEVVRNQTDGFRSTPVFAGTRMYLRTFGHLYCFGK